MSGVSDTDVMNIMLQLGVILLAGRVLAEVARRLRQPAVVGEIVAGILLGPTLFGMLFPSVMHDLFYPESSALIMYGFVQVSVVLLLFVAGLEVDLHIVFQQGRQTFFVAAVGLVIPFVLGFAVSHGSPQFFGHPDEDRLLAFSLFTGVAFSITALPVIARILMDLGLLKSRIGTVIISSAMLNDIVGWLIFSVVLSMINFGTTTMTFGQSITYTLAFALLLLTAGRWMLNKSLPWINKQLAWPGGLLSVSVGFCFLAAALTEFFGIHGFIGAFLVGIALGDSEHMSERAKEIVHQFINNIFGPIFFVSIGLRVDFLTHFDPWMTAGILVLIVGGKVVGCGLGSRAGGYSWRESMAIGFGMTSGGSIEIILGLIALEAGLIGEDIFVSLVVVALLTSMMAGPLMRWSLGLEKKEEGRVVE